MTEHRMMTTVRVMRTYVDNDSANKTGNSQRPILPDFIPIFHSFTVKILVLDVQQAKLILDLTDDKIKYVSKSSNHYEGLIHI